MSDDRQLLQRFTAERSDAVFGELVRRHLPLVYSTAMRQTGGDEHLAKDVAQLVFTDLARKARCLSENVILAGWLHRATIFAARQILRGERRRREREQEAVAMNAPSSDTENDWQQIRPLLDEALERLGKADRDALLLRFFEQQSFAQIGANLGGSEDAARKRITRALEKLRARLQKHGVTTTAAALSTVMSANAIQTVPVGLSTALTNTSLAAPAMGTTFTFLKIMTATQFKLGLSALVVAGATTAFVIHESRLLAESQQRQMVRAKLNDAGKIVVDFILFSEDNHGQFPTNFNQIGVYLNKYPLSGTNDFKIVFQGSLNEITNPGNIIVVQEPQAWPTYDGKWGKVYGFADGHSLLHTEADENFHAFEQQHSVSPPPSH